MDCKHIPCAPRPIILLSIFLPFIFYTQFRPEYKSPPGPGGFYSVLVYLEVSIDEHTAYSCTLARAEHCGKSEVLSMIVSYIHKAALPASSKRYSIY